VGLGYVRIEIHVRCVLFKSVSVGQELTVYMLKYIDFIPTGQMLVYNKQPNSLPVHT
jgi:hypothetical protein